MMEGPVIAGRASTKFYRPNLHVKLNSCKKCPHSNYLYLHSSKSISS